MNNKSPLKTDFFENVRGFLMVYLPKNRCLSAHTIKSYRDTINLFRIFLDEEKNIPFGKITFDIICTDLIYDFLKWLEITRKCGASTKNQRLTSLKSFLNYCAIEDPALTAISLRISKIRQIKSRKEGLSYLSQEELKTLMDQPDIQNKIAFRNRFFMILLYDTGARIQEIINLELQSFALDFDTPLVYLNGKGDKIRAVPLMDKTIVHLKEYLKRFHSNSQGENVPLFYTTIKGISGAISQDTVNLFLKKYAKTAKETCQSIPKSVHAHMFRHSRAMHLYQSGIPLSYIKDFLGHTSINTTSIYASADTSMIKEALEKAAKINVDQPQPIWEGDEDMILKLCGLK